MSPPEQRSQPIQAPKGTRDYYPADMLRRRYIEKAWRDVSVRHGFEEIDGPTFEATDLYTVKSGEGIVSEIFGVFSGKDEEQVRAAGTGHAPFALRPEFTPTLARMYAARAAQLPRPTKWFWQQNCFRAERPQRGRLREFLQWNLDFLGGADAVEPESSHLVGDFEVLACCVALLESLGLTSRDLRIKISFRKAVAKELARRGVQEDKHAAAFELLDQLRKVTPQQFEDRVAELGLPRDSLNAFRDAKPIPMGDLLARPANDPLNWLAAETQQWGIFEWCELDWSIARGLAYYTGMVFEVHEASGAERAIAGGGRYDNLIELFGGPPTPAVGFGMGDVVLSLVLQDRGLMPEGKALLDRLSEPGASYRPDVFVISNGTPEADTRLRPLVSALRRGRLHARHTYKATKNIGKILKEASDAGARFAAIIESASEATLKDLDGGTQERVPIPEVGARVAASR
jgi:histidyl-tRNA synthetase